MGETGIPYLTKVWNVTRGCQAVSEGCAHCYAEALAARFSGPGLPYEGLTDKGRWNGQVRVVREKLEEPYRWKKPQIVGADFMSDLFHESVPDGVLAWVWMLMTKTDHLYVVLTKRPERMLSFVRRWLDLSGEGSAFYGVRGPEATRQQHPSGRGQLFAAYLDELGKPYGGQPPDGYAWPTFDWAEGPRWWPRLPLSNVILMVTAENQARADERIPLLLQTPARWRGVSYEPALGPLDLSAVPWPGAMGRLGFLVGALPDPTEYDDWRYWTKQRSIDWVVAGAESGPHARPAELDWFRSVRDQCQAAGVPFWLKQMTVDGKLVKEPQLDGREWREFPA